MSMRRPASGIVRTAIVLASMLAGSAARPADLLITNARLFPATGAPVIESANIAVTGRYIETISSGRLRPGGGRVVDAHGMTVMPGLIDAHIHLLFDFPPLASSSLAKVWYPKSEVEARAYVDKRLREKLAGLLQHGITSVLSSIDFWPLIVEVRERLERGELVGPRLFVSGGVFAAPGAHPLCEGNAWCAEHIAVQAGTHEEALEGVRRYADSGVNQIVLVYDRLVRPAPLSPAVVMAVTRAAHARNLRVFLEAPVNASDVNDLVSWGIDGFLHPPGVLQDVDGTLLKTAGAKHLPVAITLGVAEERLRRSTSGDPHVREGYDIARHNTLALLRAGATPIFGTDLGDKQGLSPPDLIRIGIRALGSLGLTPEQILHAATRDAARLMLARNDLGTLEPGKIADIVIVDGDPLGNPEALANVVLVIKDGKVVADRRFEKDQN